MVLVFLIKDIKNFRMIFGMRRLLLLTLNFIFYISHFKTEKIDVHLTFFISANFKAKEIKIRFVPVNYFADSFNDGLSMKHQLLGALILQ